MTDTIALDGFGLLRRGTVLARQPRHRRLAGPADIAAVQVDGRLVVDGKRP